jgi:outer membrane protein OmpA-like peptidoglycan-associated protein
MPRSICVRVDSRDLAVLCEVRDHAAGALTLTTVEPDQRAADLRFTLVDGERLLPLGSMHLTRLPRNPRLDVDCSIDGRRAAISVSLDGTLLRSAAYRIHRMRPGFAAAILAGSVLALAAIVVALALTVDRPGSARVPGIAGTATQEPSGAPATPPKTSTEAPSPAAPNTPVGISLSATVYFRPDDSGLTREATRLLESMLDDLHGLGDRRVVITGHCALAGTERGRLDLSQNRARSVFAFLSARGFRPQLEPIVQGVGGESPVTLEPDLQYLNRRVEITLEGQTASP